MLFKLSLRNAKRIWKDYFVFFVTLLIVTGLIYSFNGLIFSKEILVLLYDSDAWTTIAFMLAVATFFIIFIMSWLVQYIIGFMIKKRSREYATYLLLGMKYGQIIRGFWIESLIMGTAALFMGILSGILLQQAVFYFCYTLLNKNYHFHLSWSNGCFIATLLSFLLIYIPSLFYKHTKLQKMSIADYLEMDRKNEVVRNKNSFLSIVSFIIGILYIFLWEKLFYFYTDKINVRIFLGLSFCLAAAVYYIFSGIVTIISLYLKRRGRLLYKGLCAFVLRQLSSKIQTLKFTFTILTLLLTFSLIMFSVASMFQKYQQTQIDYKYPFSMSFHGEPDTDLQAVSSTIRNYIPDADIELFGIYQNGSCRMKDFLLKNLKLFDGKFIDANDKLEQDESALHRYYYDYDTFIKLSEYNALRKLLGLKKVSVGENGYILQIKNRVWDEIKDSVSSVTIPVGEKELHLDSVYTDGFCQDGHLGADYLLVVSDNAVLDMNLYFTGLEAMFSDDVQTDVIYEAWSKVIPYTSMTSFPASGTDDFMLQVTNTLVAAEMNEIKGMFLMMIFIIVYIGLTYLCVALAVLSVQQLSDLSKTRLQYRILKLLGAGRKKRKHMIFVQMALFYVFPAVIAAFIASTTIISISQSFLYRSGVEGMVFEYLCFSLGLLSAIYFIYFIVIFV